jgi:heme O synthase-like polyprenyltransferase
MGGLEKRLKFQKQQAKSLISIYLELSKLNILSLVLVATLLGYYLGNMGIGSWDKLVFTLLGTSLTAAGSGALNHYLEREPDKLMERTKNRPLPAGLISPIHVILYGYGREFTAGVSGEYPDRNFIFINGIFIYHGLYTIKKNYLVKYIHWIYPWCITHHWWLDGCHRRNWYHGFDPVWHYVSLAASAFLCNCLDVQG